MPRPPSVKFVTAVIRRVQRYKGWDHLFLGRCGPASIAINETLLDGAGKYLVLIRRGTSGAFPRKWTGHVALLYKGKVFDYQGMSSWEGFAFWGSIPGDKPVVLVDVSRAEVVRRFVKPCTGDWDERATDCLERARKAELKSRRAA